MKETRFLSLLLALLFVLTLSGCAGTPPADSVSSYPAFDSSAPEAPPKEPSADELRGGRLIYSEDFEAFGENTGNTSLDDLGWRAQAMEDGAYNVCTAAFLITEHQGSKKLYINNNKEDAKDSYVLILDDGQMGFFNEDSYTVQYDLYYTDASAADRYIGIVNEYGGTSYNTFFVRNNGKGQHQIHTKDNSWYTYDAKDGGAYCSHTDIRSLASVLLSKSFSSQSSAFRDISFSVRYVVDRENGYFAYIRINDAGYPGSGKWTLVSETSSAADAYPYFNTSGSASALALKVGGRQNGYIDNIIVWEGTGEEPADKSAPLVRSSERVCFDHRYEENAADCTRAYECVYCGVAEAKAHSFAEVEGTDDRVCTVCQRYESNIDTDWLIERIPSYSGGEISDEIYLCGQSISDVIDGRSAESEMLVISRTSAQQFQNYLQKLETYGYERTYKKELDSNIYAQYEKNGRFIWTYYTASVGEVRVIDDAATKYTAEEFGYTTALQNGTAELYQYGLPMNANGVNISSSADKKLNNGMMYILRLADNSVFIIDGGSYKQFDTAQVDGLMSFLRKITGTAPNEKVRISAWYITHIHDDHLTGMMQFLKKHHAKLSLERVMLNAPSAYTPNASLATARPLYTRYASYLDKYFGTDNIKFLKMHTGQSINIADVQIDVLYTHEDIVAPDGTSEIVTDFNNSTTAAKITFGSKTFLVTGDMHKPAMNIVLQSYTNSTLKCDVLQVAHHCYNDLSALYSKVKAVAVLFPQSPGGCVYNASRKKTHDAAIAFADKSLVFYASESTARISTDGTVITGEYTEKVHGGGYTGSWTPW